MPQRAAELSNMHGGFSKVTVVRVGLLVAKVTLASWGWRFTPAGGSEDGS